MKLKRLSLLIVVLVCIISQNVLAGGHESHGGDLIYCSKSDKNSLEGYYTLDYVLTFRKSNDNEDLVSVESWEASRNRIQAILDQKLPDFARSFADYTSLLNNHDDYTQNRIWKEAAFGLFDISDEDIKRKIPANCTMNDDKISLTQVVVRTKIDEFITYEYDYDRVHDLEMNRSLQFSFLMVHEWLRDYVNDAEQIRTITRFLHSNQFEEQTRKQILNFLRRNGIYALPIQSEKVFERLNLKSTDERSCNYRVGFFSGGIVLEAIECGKQVQRGLVGLKAVFKERDDFYGERSGKIVFWIDKEESKAVNQNHFLSRWWLDYSYVEFVNDKEIDIFSDTIKNSPFRYTER